MIRPFPRFTQGLECEISYDTEDEDECKDDNCLNCEREKSDEHDELFNEQRDQRDQGQYAADTSKYA